MKCYFSKSLEDISPARNAKLHIVEDDGTLCGKAFRTGGRWIIVGDIEKTTCEKCLEIEGRIDESTNSKNTPS